MHLHFWGTLLLPPISLWLGQLFADRRLPIPITIQLFQVNTFLDMVIMNCNYRNTSDSISLQNSSDFFSRNFRWHWAGSPYCWSEGAYELVIVNSKMKRYVYVNDDDLSQNLYCDNRVSNRKYTAWNFLPKNLWEQFR